MAQISQYTQEKFGQKPVLIFDQADSLLKGDKQQQFMEKLVQNFGFEAHKSQLYSVVFIGSQSNIVEKYFSSGGIGSRKLTVYSRGFTSKEVCYLWILKTLMKANNQTYAKMKDHYQKICTLYVVKPYDQKENQKLNEADITRIDSTLNITQVQTHYQIFWKIYGLSGDYYQAMRLTEGHTKTYVKELYENFCNSEKLAAHPLTEENSEAFWIKLLNNTEDGFDSYQKQNFLPNQTKSAAAHSNLIRVEPDIQPYVATYKFRIPYFSTLLNKTFNP